MYEFLKKLFKEVDGQPEAITAEELIKRIQADKTHGTWHRAEVLRYPDTGLSGGSAPVVKLLNFRLWADISHDSRAGVNRNLNKISEERSSSCFFTPESSVILASSFSFAT